MRTKEMILADVREIVSAAKNGDLSDKEAEIGVPIVIEIKKLEILIDIRDVLQNISHTLDEILITRQHKRFCE